MAKIPTPRLPLARLLALVLACASAGASRAQDSPASPWPAKAASAPDASEPDRSLALPALEIATFAPEAIPWPGIAFKTSYWAIRDWLHRRRPDIHPADRHWDE